MNKKLVSSILRYASLSEGLKTKDFRVLLYLMPDLKNGEYVKINPSKIAEDLNIARSDVSKSVRRLIEKQIIQPLNLGGGWKLILRLHPYNQYEINKCISESLNNEDMYEY